MSAGPLPIPAATPTRSPGSPRRRLRARLERAALLLLVSAATACAAPPHPTDSSLPADSPLRPLIISGFGDWRGRGDASRAWRHYGLDIRVPVGTPVLAAADGRVVRVGEQRNSGKLVIVAHEDDLATVYFHLRETHVAVGRTLRRGEMLGRSGMTGNATTPHLHFGVCRRAGGQCGARIDAGWDNPGSYWIEGDPCFAPGRSYRGTSVRLTYPVSCPGSAPGS